MYSPAHKLITRQLCWSALCMVGPSAVLPNVCIAWIKLQICLSPIDVITSVHVVDTHTVITSAAHETNECITIDVIDLFTNECFIQ